VTDGAKALQITVRGTVQGVGFRPYVYRLAEEMRLTGWVQNRSGDVTIVVEGSAEAVARFRERLVSELPPLAHLDRLEEREVGVSGAREFSIRASAGVGGHQPVSPDVAICAACRAELLDDADRRYLYPFINCTDCGPRYTIIERVPYDRPNTTMKAFPLCDYCRGQYEDPGDRRFHAQPVACPVCGPQIWLERGGAATHGPAAEVIERAAEVLRRGEALAVKGLGGFHVAVDATNDRAVSLLRERKRRPHKALAVMMLDEDVVREHCRLESGAAALLSSPAAPIVLLPLRHDRRSRLSPRLASDHDSLGVMLPYTPLHLLLLRAFGRPLVMTSGNVSDEPLAVDNDEARHRLGAIVDAYLMHNRPIQMPCDDSVVDLMRPGASGPVRPQVVRRARGYAPGSIVLPVPGPQVLGVGPEMKATVTVARDDSAYVSQHLGDLDNALAEDHFRRVGVQFEDLFSVRPAVIAHDLHPDYFSTRYALERAAQEGQDLVPVQHHHAHALSCLLENDPDLLSRSVPAVILDGTGYGTDGRIWGGEWLTVSGGQVERNYHLQYVPLVGGDAGVRRVDRLAATYLMALDLGDQVRSLPALAHLADWELDLLAVGLHSPSTVSTSSMGRLFDVVAGLLGLSGEVTYEAQAAIRLQTLAERVADSDSEGGYEWYAKDGVIELGALLGAVLADTGAGRPAEEIALRFHRTVADMVTLLGGEVARAAGSKVVALSGGCFQNRLLTSLCVGKLREAGLEPLLHRQLPPNDGCVSLGQVVAARLQTRD